MVAAGAKRRPAGTERRLVGVMRRMFLGLAALFLFHVSAQQAEAQFLGEVVCWWCIEEEGEHGFNLNGQGCGSEGEYPGHPAPSQCVRCGGTSECHYDDRPGSCHIACGPAGDVLVVETEFQEALENEDITVVASALLKGRTGVSAEFIPEGGRIDLLLPCDPNRPVRIIPVLPQLRDALMVELEQHPGRYTTVVSSSWKVPVFLEQRS